MLIFTLCPLVAIHFGEASAGAGSIRGTIFQYFRSPIFIAVVLGFAVSQLHLPLASPFWGPSSLSAINAKANWLPP